MTTYKPPSPEIITARFKGGSQNPKGITLHATVSSDNPGTARAIAEWWHGPTSPKTSAHYVVDPKETIQCVGDHTVAYHCGSNQDCIGVELCDEQTGPATRWADGDSKAILARGAHLVAQLCLAYDIEPRRPSVAELKEKGKHGIYGHNDSRLAFGNTTHTDPGPDFPWTSFLAQVKAEITKLKGSTTVAKTDPNAPPSAHTHLVSEFNENHSISLPDVSTVQKGKREPWHTAAGKLHTAINKAWDDYEEATK